MQKFQYSVKVIWEVLQVLGPEMRNKIYNLEIGLRQL